MKIERIARNYIGLDANQMAALAFHYIVDDDELEFSRLSSSIPLKYYRCPDVIYQDALDQLKVFASAWALEYWQARCHMAELLSASLAKTLLDDYEMSDLYLDQHGQAEIHLLTLDTVLESVCEQLRINPADVRKLADIKPYKPRRDGLKPDADLQACMHAHYLSLMNKGE